MEWESNERGILIERHYGVKRKWKFLNGKINKKGVCGNILHPHKSVVNKKKKEETQQQENFQESTNMTPAKTPSNNGKGSPVIKLVNTPTIIIDPSSVTERTR